MLTSDKIITTPEFWNDVYSGKRNDKPTDASNNKRPANSFDRFTWVANYSEGPNVLEVAAGHAHISKRIKAAHKDWNVIASDQTAAAVEVARYIEYAVFNCYNIPFPKKHFDTIIIAQAMEYLEYQEMFLDEAKRVANKIIITLPIDEMKLWSQLRIYTEANVLELLTPYGDFEVFEREGDLLLVKIKFHD